MAYPSALDLDIANTALARISERAISSFTENSPAARAVSRIYPKTRNLLFSAADWRFATARATLSNPSAGVYPWAYQYALPPMVARCRMVLPGQAPVAGVGGDPVPFEEGVFTADGVNFFRGFRCDINPATLVYTAQLQDPGTWDDGFISTLTFQLAAELCLPITGNGQIAKLMQEAAQQSLAAQMPLGQEQSITPQSRGPSTTTAARDAG